MGLQKIDVFLWLLITHFHVNSHAYVDKIFSAVLFSVYYVMFLLSQFQIPVALF